MIRKNLICAYEQALRNHLAVRDSLRANPALLKEYSDLKFKLARKFPEDIDLYVKGKSSFLLTILGNQGFVTRELEEIEEMNSKLPTLGLVSLPMLN